MLIIMVFQYRSDGRKLLVIRVSGTNRELKVL